jgi:hypothetical protein
VPFFQTPKLPKLSEEKQKAWWHPSTKEIELTIDDTQEVKAPGPGGSSGESYQTFKEELYQFFTNAPSK